MKKSLFHCLNEKVFVSLSNTFAAHNLARNPMKKKERKCMSLRSFLQEKRNPIELASRFITIQIKYTSLDSIMILTR